MLQPVNLTPADSCLTYVLQRGGYADAVKFDQNDWLNFYEWMDDNFTFHTYDPAAAVPGDLLYWKPKDDLLLPISIDTWGRTLYKIVPSAWHFAIVENDGLYSDITRSMVLFRITINMASLGTFTRGNPAFILRVKKL